MPRPTISVITPVHPARVRNGMLRRAQQSVADQTLLPDAHCVAVDLDEAGAAPTRDRALRMASTDWVATLDSDDYFLPRHLEWLLRHAQATDADLVYSWFKVQTADGTILEDDPVFPITHYLNPFDPTDPIETTITVLVRNELARQVGYVALNRGHNQNSGEDRRFTLECLKAGAKIEHLVRKSWIWAHHGQNTSGLSTKGDAA
jgi:glycosyltransferase involved in cell wall biosynthesis